MKWLTMNVAVALLAAPGFLSGQAEHAAIQVVESDDGMTSWVYAFVRTEAGPVESIESTGIAFGRDPILLFACMEGEVVVVYRFDTELLGDDENTVWVQQRFDEQRGGKRQSWPSLLDPWAAREFEIGLAAMGGDSANPLIQMFAALTTAAKMPAKATAEFLEAAGVAAQVTLRVTDPADGETYTDVFSLTGFAEALGSVRQGCP